MGSGKGQAKRTSLINPIKKIKSLVDDTKDYQKIKNLVLNNNAFKLDLNKQSEYGKFNQEIMEFMKQENFSFTEYRKGYPVSDTLLQDDIDYFEGGSKAMGVCHFTTNPETKKQEIRISINHDRIEDEFLNTIASITSADPKFADYDYETNFLGSGRKAADIYANYKQRIILHEIGHAMMGISSWRNSSPYEEFKADLFAKKILDEMYGSEDFHSLAIVVYVKTIFEKLSSETSDKNALNELANASLTASKAARKMLDYLGIK